MPLVVKIMPANAGDTREVQSLGQEDPLEEGMATHSYSYLENPMDRGAWLCYGPYGHRELDMTEAT